MTRISKFSTGSSADDQKKVLKALTKSKNLVFNCINVVPQKEAECAAISVGLAVKLCFSAPAERSLFKEFVRTRQDFVECLRKNCLTDFHTKEVARSCERDVLFSMNI